MSDRKEGGNWWCMLMISYALNHNVTRHPLMLKAIVAFEDHIIINILVLSESCSWLSVLSVSSYLYGISSCMARTNFSVSCIRNSRGSVQWYNRIANIICKVRKYYIMCNLSFIEHIPRILYPCMCGAYLGHGIKSCGNNCGYWNLL